MVEPFNETIMFEIIQDVLNTENLDHLSIEDQMLVLDTIADSIKKYKAKELDNLLDELDSTYNNRKLSDL